MWAQPPTALVDTSMINSCSQSMNHCRPGLHAIASLVERIRCMLMRQLGQIWIEQLEAMPLGTRDAQVDWHKEMPCNPHAHTS